MNQYRFHLEKYKNRASRHTCPECGFKHTLALYVDIDTNEPLADHVGRCNREDKCGYHYTPAQYYQTNPDGAPTTPFVKSNVPAVIKPLDYIIKSDLQRSLSRYDINAFAAYLVALLGPDKATVAIERYIMGTSNKWPGANIFWYIDAKGNIRTGKIMLYDPRTGKRVKQPFPHIYWVHNHYPDGNYKQCLFGEHLLARFPSAPVALVESEKTAIIASAYMPDLIWLATGGLSNLSYDKCKVLKGRKVVLYPDVNGYDKWKEKLTDLETITKFTLSDLLERNATDHQRAEGWDLADYLVQDTYITPEPITDEAEPERATKARVEQQHHTGCQPAQAAWDLTGLEAYFNAVAMPPSIELHPSEKIDNIPFFIESHLSIIKNHEGEQAYYQCYLRLIDLRNRLTAQH